jgi:hypothetical protein
VLIKTKETDFSIPFPQANDVYKVIKYVDEMLYRYHEECLRHISLDVVDRQEGYYRSAAHYLGLMSDNKTTDLAEVFFRMEKNHLFCFIALTILQNDVFLNFYTNRDIDYVVSYLKYNYSFSEKTARRRASTLKGWIDWCDIIIKENNIEVVVYDSR